MADEPAYLAVFGTRTFADFALLRERLDRYTAHLPRLVVVTGEWRAVGYGTPGYIGADLLAEQWAHQVRKCPVQQFPPPFADFPDTLKGRTAAFHARNRAMIEFVSAQRDGFSVAFWDGRSPGTASVIELCRKHRVPLRTVRY